MKFFLQIRLLAWLSPGGLLHYFDFQYGIYFAKVIGQTEIYVSQFFSSENTGEFILRNFTAESLTAFQKLHYRAEIVTYSIPVPLSQHLIFALRQNHFRA